MIDPLSLNRRKSLAIFFIAFVLVTCLTIVYLEDSVDYWKQFVNWNNNGTNKFNNWLSQLYNRSSWIPAAANLSRATQGLAQAGAQGAVNELSFTTVPLRKRESCRQPGTIQSLQSAFYLSTNNSTKLISHLHAFSC